MTSRSPAAKFWVPVVGDHHTKRWRVGLCCGYRDTADGWFECDWVTSDAYLVERLGENPAFLEFSVGVTWPVGGSVVTGRLDHIAAVEAELGRGACPGPRVTGLRVLADDEYPQHVGDVLTIPTTPIDIPAAPSPTPKRRGWLRRRRESVEKTDEKLRLLETLGAPRDDWDPLDFWADQSARRARRRRPLGQSVHAPDARLGRVSASTSGACTHPPPSHESPARSR